MKPAKDTPPNLRRELATLILAVAGESVSMVKRNVPEHSMGMKPKEEWGIYLEFLKIMFNFADRFSAMYLPLKAQPEFMDALEDSVADQLKAVLAPALTGDSDPMEIVLTIGNTVSESRKIYEPFRFHVMESSQEKESCVNELANRVAEATGTTGKGLVNSAATLCVTAVIPAMKSLFDELIGGKPKSESTMTANQPHSNSGGTEPGPKPVGQEIKLVSVMSSIQHEEVETRWGMHPQFRQDLTLEESKELSRLMNQVTKILGERYASVAFSETWTSWHLPGQAGHA